MLKVLKSPLALCAALVASCLIGPLAQAAQKKGNQNFDFYVLSLSWSPSWCATHPEGRNSQQCDPNRNYGYIVHGLWPQNEHGYPQFCPTRESDRVPTNLGRRYLDIIPSMGLIGHEWRKHGVCSGMTQVDYFATVRAAYDAVTIPPALAHLKQAKSVNPELLEKAFIAANPGMKPDGIAVSCSTKMLDEIRICLNKDLSFRSCDEVDRQSCPLNSVKIPPIQ